MSSGRPFRFKTIVFWRNTRPNAERLVAVHPVHEPGRLAPRALGLLLVADALLDAVAAEHEHVAEDRVAGVVHLARQRASSAG